MLVLGIESSCDETAAALVHSDGTVLSDVVYSQSALHAPHGGVIPELASRAHVQRIAPTIEQAIAQTPLSEVDAIAVTQGPGLVGALLVGVQAAKAIAFARDLPLVGVDHLVAHLFAVFLKREGDPNLQPEFPFVALLVSGGHTALYEVRGPSEASILGQPRDDAAGEAFDKVAKMLGLGYPGGPLVDRLAQKGDAGAIDLPTPMSSRRSFDFSFSGLKTAVARRVRERPSGERDETWQANVCAAFQRSVVRVLVKKALAACEVRHIPRLVLGGGVAANAGLRAHAKAQCARRSVSLFVPSIRSCTDNAAMIAYAGALELERAGPSSDPLGFSVYSRSPDLRRGKFPKRR